jgi:pimeloyl-ACP methyl ester carboxylesterase
MIPTPELLMLGGEGPPVLLIHGYGADRQSWLATAPALFSIAQVWVLDLAGHGSSNTDCGDGTVNTLAASVFSALHDAEIENVHLVGHSLGGRIAIEMAIQQPKQISSLALLSPAGVNRQINQDFLTRFHQADTEQSVYALLQMLVHDPRLIAPMLATGVLEYLNKPGVRASLALITTALLESSESRNAMLLRLKNTSIPYTGIWGANDNINSPDADTIAQLGCPTHVLDNCGHLPHIEKRTHVNKLLTAFIDEVNAS